MVHAIYKTELVGDYMNINELTQIRDLEYTVDWIVVQLAQFVKNELPVGPFSMVTSPQLKKMKRRVQTEI